jgi:FkbM family methyltransferase
MTLRSLVRVALLDPLRTLLPARFRLGYDFLLLRLTGRAEEELLELDRLLDRRDLAVDVGANRGFYSYAFTRRFRRVVAFEPNPSIVADLERLGAANLEVHNVALSSGEGKLELYVPRVNGQEQHGWASFDRGNLPGATDFKVLEVPVRPLDAFGLKGVSFIKIDVEGHEVAALAGAAATIRDSQPTVLIEVKDRNRGEVMGFFDRLGYAPFRLRGGKLVPWAPNGGDDQGENFVFRPRPAT